jgi:DNA-binding NarL/FixJ family response regulator
MNEAIKIRVFSVDDHPLMHEGLATVIKNQPDMQLIAEASNGREAIQRFREHTPDVTLMDLRLPDMSGVDAMIAIRTEFPEARIIILTTFAGDVEIQHALEGGARAYVLKSMSPKELVEVIRQFMSVKGLFRPRLQQIWLSIIATRLSPFARSKCFVKSRAEIVTAISPTNSSLRKRR